MSVRYYKKVEKAKVFRGLKMDILRIICDYPKGVTAETIHKEYIRRYGIDKSKNDIEKRIADLSNWSAIVTNGLVRSDITNRNTKKWKASNKTPVKPVPMRKVKQKVSVDFRTVEFGFDNMHNLTMLTNILNVLGRSKLARFVLKICGIKTTPKTFYNIRETLRDYGHALISFSSPATEFIRPEVPNKSRTNFGLFVSRLENDD